MKVFLINIPTPEMEESYGQCYEVLEDYFKRHNIDTFVLRNNDFGVDPSWLKLKCFDYVQDDFIICWDMDLLPRKSTENVSNYMDHVKINLVRDTNLITGAVAPHPAAPYFRYNCGLIGIPRIYRPMLEKVFLEAKTSTLPSYEQYPLNHELSKNGFADVHELDKTWNCIFHLPGPQSFMSQAKLIHYTGLDRKTREMLISRHRTAYLSQLV